MLEKVSSYIKKKAWTKYTNCLGNITHHTAAGNLLIRKPLSIVFKVETLPCGAKPYINNMQKCYTLLWAKLFWDGLTWKVSLSLMSPHLNFFQRSWLLCPSGEIWKSTIHIVSVMVWRCVGAHGMGNKCKNAAIQTTNLIPAGQCQLTLCLCRNLTALPAVQTCLPK